MKVLVYNSRKDELQFIQKFGEQFGLEVQLTDQTPTVKTAKLAKGCKAVSVVTSDVNAKVIQALHKYGVELISTRTIGYDHIDLKTAKKLGMKVSNVMYSPSSVADYTVMLILMAIRKIKHILALSEVQNFSLNGVRGRELHNLTVGIVGTGRIGQRVIENLSGFGCKMLAYDLFQNEKVKKFATYVPLDELIKSSDVITLHVPASEDNYHMICKESLNKMKEGVILINTARGSLIDTAGLIEAIESKKIGAAALDVVENETGLYYNNLTGEPILNRELAVLKSFPNVIVTPHTAFYTDQAVSDMVEHSLHSCALYLQGKENPYLVKN